MRVIGGKLIGAILGLISYGPAGMVLGLVLGQIFDRALSKVLQMPKHPNAVRLVFFKTVFQIMGYLAKADGIVSEQEISVARSIMLHDFKLDKRQMLMAIGYFNEGKKSNFDLLETLNKFRVSCGKFSDLRQFFLELLVKSCLVNNTLREEKRVLLIFICNSLGIQLSELDYQLRVYGARPYTTNKSYNYYDAHDAKFKSDDELTLAYNMLGVKSTDSIKTIKNAYRRLMSKYHPDKLVAKGLPPEMMNIAKEKTQKIAVAYDLIMRSRG